MDEEKRKEGNTGTRRSSRISGGSYGKRKRSISTEEDNRSKMTKNDTAQGTPSVVNFTFNDITNFMNGEFLTNIKANIDENNRRLEDKIDKTQAELKTHKNHVERELAKMRNELGNNQGTPSMAVSGSYAEAAANTGAVTKTDNEVRKESREERQYWRARRSARFFPIDGTTDEELRKSLADFCIVKLRIPSEDVNDEDVEQIRRVRLRRGKPNLGEVIVLFADLDTRDRIASFARNLGMFVDPTGKPTAGIRYDIPDHLAGVHRTLLQYGHALWTKYKKDPEFKRNIRFDDVQMTYCLDVKLPQKKNWVTVSYKRALRDRKASINVEAEDDDEMLSTLGEVPVVEEEVNLGANSANGTVMTTSWRAPDQGNKK